MAKDKLTEYSATNASNDVIGDISVAEGMLPSAVNNALREQMTHLKNFSDGTDGIDVLSLADDDASASIKIQAPSAVTTTTTLTLPDGDGDAGAMLQTNGSGQLAWSTAYRNRNLVTNGACQVAQRSSSVTGITSNGYYTVDRFTHYLGGGGTWTSAQDSNAPSGFANSLKLTCTTANASPSAGTYSEISYLIEAQDLQRLGFGTSTAKTCTLSFWVKSNKTGNFSIYFLQRDNSNKLFSTHYTINTADTWEYKTLTVPADTSGVINDDNGVGMDFTFGLSYGTNFTSGSEQTSWGTNVNANRGAGLNVNLADATSNYWQITGVQLEVGEQATPFEHRSFGDEFAACQRYYIDCGTLLVQGYGYGSGGDGSGSALMFPVTMRSTPTMSKTSEDDDGSSASLIFNFTSSRGTSLEAQSTNGSHSNYVHASVTADSEL